MQRKHLFDIYIDRMLKHPRSKNTSFERKDVDHWLSWLAQKMITYRATPYLIENMQPTWLTKKQARGYILSIRLIGGLISGLIFGLSGGRVGGLIGGLSVGLNVLLIGGMNKIPTIGTLSWDRMKAREGFKRGLSFGLIFGLMCGLIVIFDVELHDMPISKLMLALSLVPTMGLIFGLVNGLSVQQTEPQTYPGQRLVITTQNLLFNFLFFGLVGGLIGGFSSGLIDWLSIGLIFGLMFGSVLNGIALILHYSLRFILARNNNLPWKLIPFLDYCTELIFLRRVGGGYIFVHRLLMEHFAAMYKENE